ncbi:MAG: DUF1559 domain-containing protein, partial [Planctomycetota bacterium]|nr:DUF1559 domain-containing protein [Planctomycetota bacterium]
MDSVWDGQSQTILATENLNAGESGGIRTWSNPNWRTAAFVYPLKVGAGSYYPYDDPVLPVVSGAKLGVINGQTGGLEGGSPFPSSFHPQGCNFLFVDGHVSFLSSQMDERVYGLLISPSGTRRRAGIGQQKPLSDNF